MVIGLPRSVRDVAKRILKIKAQKVLKLLHFGKTAPLFPNTWANVIIFLLKLKYKPTTHKL